VLEKAKSRGSNVHAICAAILQDLWVPAIDEDCRLYIESFQLWRKTALDHVILIEQKLIDENLGFCGHPDLICLLNGNMQLVLVDFKTPRVKSKSWRLQLAAYKHLAKVNGFDVSRVGSLRLSPDGNMPIFDEYTEASGQDLNIFLSALNCHRFFKEAA
jgi:hypothetical protein